MKQTKILFCWSGGGFPGVDIHIGIWKALEEKHIYADANAGTSAGAIIAALNSSGRSCATAEKIVRSLRDKDIRRERIAWKLRMFWLPSFLSLKPIEKILSRLLPGTFGKLLKPLSVFCTVDKTGDPAEIRTGDLPQAVLASMAISGVFPNVSGYSDGGTVANLPLPSGWEEEYDEVYLLIASRSLKYKRRRKSILSRLFYNIDLLMEDQLRDTIALAEAMHPCVRVIRPDISPRSGTLRFDHDLIDKAYEETKRLL